MYPDPICSISETIQRTLQLLRPRTLSVDGFESWRRKATSDDVTLWETQGECISRREGTNLIGEHYF